MIVWMILNTVGISVNGLIRSRLFCLNLFLSMRSGLTSTVNHDEPKSGSESMISLEAKNDYHVNI